MFFPGSWLLHRAPEAPVLPYLRTFASLPQVVARSHSFSEDQQWTDSSQLGHPLRAYLSLPGWETIWDAIFYPICAQDTYKELVELIIQSQAQEENNRQRLVEAFSQLTHNIPLSAERIHRIRFRDNFDKFIVNVRGFLFVKWLRVSEIIIN